MSAFPLRSSQPGHTVYPLYSRKRSDFRPLSLLAQRNRGAGGFSLIEMVVVIGIIGVIVAIGMSAFSGGPGVLLSTSTAQVSSAISGARQLAVSQNCRTRFYILLNEDPNKPEWRLRGYGILKEELGVTDNGRPYFRPASGLNLLREGIFFQRDLPVEGQDDDSEPAPEGQQLLDRTPGEMSFQNVDRVQYAFIEFLPTGGTTTPSTGNIVRLERGLEPGVPMPNQTNYARIGVAQHTGRVKIERPEIQ